MNTLNKKYFYEGKWGLMERRMSTRSEKYWTESGRGDGEGDVEKKDHQSYRRPYMMGKARGKVSK